MSKSNSYLNYPSLCSYLSVSLWNVFDVLLNPTPRACASLKSHFIKKSFCLFLLSLIRHTVLTWELLLSVLVIYLAVLRLRCGTWDLLVATCMLRTPLAQYLWLMGVVAPRHAGSLLPDQGSSLHPVLWKADSYTGKVLLTWKLSIPFKSIIAKYIFVVLISYSYIVPFYISSVQWLSYVRLFATPWTVARQASLSITNSRSLLKLMSIVQWCHPTISSSVVPFSSCLHSFPASGFLQINHFFPSGSQSKPFLSSCSMLPTSCVS